MKTFMLIHGSWHNAWNWHKVVPLIEAAGHRVICIDLPGMGRDKTPVKEVTLQKSVAKITEVIDQQPDKLILVGHSKNGIMVSQLLNTGPIKWKHWFTSLPTWFLMEKRKESMLCRIQEVY
jgi:pimeloyl-ACP methyl ester carboxylesterase